MAEDPELSIVYSLFSFLAAHTALTWACAFAFTSVCYVYGLQGEWISIPALIGRKMNEKNGADFIHSLHMMKQLFFLNQGTSSWFLFRYLE